MTTSLSHILKRTLITGTVTLFAFAPVSAYATSDTIGGCDLPDTSSQNGVHRPVGADASMYQYDCASGMWVSAHYTYNPATGGITANDPAIYTYNSGTGKYDTQTWVFNAPQGAYVQISSSVAQPPAGATVIGAPAPAAPTGSSTIGNTGAGSNNTIANNGNGGGTQAISNTGANSNNGISGSNNTNTTANNSNQLSLNNVISGQANSGNALVVGNTTAGGATTGNAQDIANIINLLQSSSSALGSGNVVSFVKNIDGDVNGDLLFDPAMLGAVQNANGQADGNNHLTINNSTDAAINNNINLNALSGDATVSQNTSAGDATTGSATAIANVVNLINSAITSGKSFIGTININGNLNGDILIPPSLIDQLIATNVPTVSIDTTGAGSNNSITNNGSDTTKVTNTNNQGITNNVKANAQTGSANVTQNTSAGDATSGNANTNITAFNLTGSNVVGSNDILVFVNVLGKWVGMIMNAPAGATAAELGGGITSTGANSNNTIANNGSDTTDITNKNNAKINNNITADAKSGDANVSQNTKAGNAKSGDAKSAVNLLNVQNSSLALSNWFGILFINVLGSWTGSFGVNTSAGDPVTAGTANIPTAPAAATATVANTTPRFFSFVPRDNGSYSIKPVAAASGSNTNTSQPTSGTVLAATTVKPAKNVAPTPTLQSAHSNFTRTAVIIGGLVLLFIISDAFYSRRHPEHA